MPVDGFPAVRITHPASGSGHAHRARLATIELDGQDITRWVSDFRVGGNVESAVELHLTVLCGSVEWTQAAVDPDAG